MALRDKAGVRAWLGSASATEEGTEKLVESLADHVERPEFLERLVSSRAAFEQDAPRGASGVQVVPAESCLFQGPSHGAFTSCLVFHLGAQPAPRT